MVFCASPSLRPTGTANCAFEEDGVSHPDPQYWPNWTKEDRTPFWDVLSDVVAAMGSGGGFESMTTRPSLDDSWVDGVGG